METFYQYLIISSISIAALYLAYYYFFRKVSDFKKIRFFLLSAMLFSLLLPFSPVSINLSTYLAFNNQKLNKSLSENIIYDASVKNFNDRSSTEFELTKSTNSALQEHYNAEQLFLIIYLAVTGLFVLRLIFSITKMILLSIYAEKIKHKNYTLILLDKRIIAFSFFNWIFIDKIIDNEELKQIIEHEKAHADQYHTFDLLFSELLVAAMWFNPFIWMFKKALTQVHEYLADEQVLNSGFNKLEYQQLLVNQAAEERLVAVSSNFSYSLIKKRIMMMQKTKTHGYSGMKFLAVIPIIVVLIFSVAVFNQPVNATTKSDAIHSTNRYAIRSNKNTKNETITATLLTKEETNTKKNTEIGVPPDTIPNHKNNENELIAAISPTKMNVLYIGVDNPVSIAVTGAQKDKIKASISNGTISGENGQYIVRVKQLGKAIITVSVDNKVVFNQEFRVKTVPDPMPSIKGKWNATLLSKSELIAANGVEVMLQNFDFDLKFEVIGFNLAAAYNGIAEDARCIGNVFSEQQIELIQKVPSGTKIYIEEIKAKGPDGAIRSLPPIIINIK
ncbi:MAG: GldM family protein [Bacteroidales bacterium]|nr:GldM family protein [Bacteroidales bacterium]